MTLLNFANIVFAGKDVYRKELVGFTFLVASIISLLIVMIKMFKVDYSCWDHADTIVYIMKAWTQTFVCLCLSLMSWETH